ncbi:MAG: hypothetical protein UY50_C0033G0012 [Parcubacteria group bacterium GW2011_GWA2_49_9]|nr:MAG: hypothetical protein UY50_C0033G0012 [Parcubacteria group bacterium GW2011_GWA2_49_9]
MSMKKYLNDPSLCVRTSLSCMLVMILWVVSPLLLAALAVTQKMPKLFLIAEFFLNLNDIAFPIFFWILLALAVWAGLLSFYGFKESRKVQDK